MVADRSVHAPMVPSRLGLQSIFIRAAATTHDGISFHEPLRALRLLRETILFCMAATQKVDVEPVARDADIAARLTRILEATGWFTDARASVEAGVFFLNGQAGSDQRKDWAGRDWPETRRASSPW